MPSINPGPINLKLIKMALYVGDVVAFVKKPVPVVPEFGRTESHYGISNLEFRPVDNEPYIVTHELGTYRVKSVLDEKRPIDWVLVYKDGKYWSCVNQCGFDYEELEMVPVTHNVDKGRVVWMAVDCEDDTDSRYAEVREMPCDDLEVSSAKIL